MAEQNLLEFRYSPFNGEEVPYDVYRDGERLFTLSEGLKKGAVKEEFREEETAEFLPGYVRTGYRIVPSPYGKPNPEGTNEVSHWKLLPPLELDRILEEKERLKESLRELAEAGKEAGERLSRLRKKLSWIKNRIEENRSDLEDFDVIYSDEFYDTTREEIRRRLIEETEELKEAEKQIEEEIKELEQKAKKAFAVLQLYNAVLDTGEKEFDEDIFVLPDYLLELEGEKVSNEEALERVKDLLGWIPETPQGLAFGLFLVGKVYGIRPEGLDVESLRNRTFETQKEAGDAVVREVERFKKEIEPLLENDSGIEL